MQRIKAIDMDQADARSRHLLNDAGKAMGLVPAVFKTMAQSPAALEGYMTFSRALAGGRLTPQLREQIALAVSGANASQYCASAHTHFGSKLGVSAEELTLNLHGESNDPKVVAALDFARRIVTERGRTGTDAINAVRQAGFTDSEIMEIVATVSLTIFGNYVNSVAGTELDFPAVEVEEPVGV